MMQGRTLQDLAKELDRQSQAKKDFRTPTNLIEVAARQDKTLQLRVADKFTGDITENMHGQLSKWAGIPTRYYDHMRQEAPSLAAANLNHWLRHNKETRMVRTLDGRGRAFLSNRYRPIDNYEVANAVLPVLVNESKKLGSVKIMSSDVTENKLYIKVASERLTYEVKKGDVVQVGISLSNSEVGHGSVRVEPFLLRLICMNGATIEDSAVRKFHVGRASAELEAAEQVYQDATRRADDHAFMLKLQDVVRAAFDDTAFEKLKGITIDATTRKVKAPIQDVVEEISDRFNLSEKHRTSFLNNLIEGGDISQWGVANAITAIANTAENYETATELENLGGRILTLDGGAWQELAS